MFCCQVSNLLPDKRIQNKVQIEKFGTLQYLNACSDACFLGRFFSTVPSHASAEAGLYDNDAFIQPSTPLQPVKTVHINIFCAGLLQRATFKEHDRIVNTYTTHRHKKVPVNLLPVNSLTETVHRVHFLNMRKW